MDKSTFAKILKITSPIFFGYVSIGIPFGLMVAKAGYPWWLAPLMSVTMYTGTGQYIAIGMFAAGASLAQIMLIQVLVGIRHIFYGLSLLTKFKGLGKWKAFCYFDPLWIGKEDFVPYENPPKGAGNYLEDPYFKEIEFMEGGHVKAVYRDQVITGDDKHVWTKGYWLRKWNSNACAYEIKIFEDKEYLIIEWKSGDYRFGGRESSYYVMVRE